MSEGGYLQRKAGFATAAIHGGNNAEKWNCRAVMPGIFTSTIFKEDVPAEDRGYSYARLNNPTREAVEECLAAVEGAKYGVTFASGLGASTAIANLLSQGDHIIAMDSMYLGTRCLFSTLLPRMGVQISFVDVRDPSEVASAMQPNTKMVWLEPPSNPMMIVADIQAICEVVHSQPGVIVVVENTLFTCYNQKPLMLGADVVLYSLSKFTNGHCDVIMGATLTNDDKLHERLRRLQIDLGIIPSPFDCSQINRSLKTLPLRMERHMENGITVAKYLEQHPLVEKVIHPGLPSHPQHDLIKKQCFGVSGMMAFYLKGGFQESKKFMSALKVVSITESFGGHKSTISLPYGMTFKSVSPEQKAELGITNNLIRFSVGLEDVEDIIADLDQAMEAAVSH